LFWQNPFHLGIIELHDRLSPLRFRENDFRADDPRVYEPQGRAGADPVSSGSSSLARRFLVRGRVQGVGFRWFVEREAHILGIAGWVRNNHDGSVEVLAQGTRDQLAGLHSRLREGPRAARVDTVEVSESVAVDGLRSFSIQGAS